MKSLKAAIAIRILDSLGVVSKEMNDIRHDAFLTKYKSEEIYSGRVNYSEKESLVFLYTEIMENDKYMISFVEDNKGNEGDLFVCIVSSDIEDESSDSNKLMIGTKTNMFREASFLESANYLKAFEVIRNHMPNWIPNKPSKEKMEYFINFIQKIAID